MAITFTGNNHSFFRRKCTTLRVLQLNTNLLKHELIKYQQLNINYDWMVMI